MVRTSATGYDLQLTVDWSETYICYFDGLCEPINPGGIATYGIVIKKGGENIHEESGLAFAKPWSKEATNNVAEYSAAIHALEWLKKGGLANSPAVLRGDSRLIIRQLRGEYKVKAPRIVELYRHASKLLTEFSSLRLQWVDRSKNKEADLLSRIAYHRYKKEFPGHYSRPTQNPF